MTPLPLSISHQLLEQWVGRFQMWTPYRYHQPRACRSAGDGLLYRLLCAHSPLCISCCKHRQLLCSVPGASTSPSRGCACSKAASGHVRGVPFRAALANSCWLIHHALPQLYMLISHLSVPGAACRVLHAPIVTGAQVRHSLAVGTCQGSMNANAPLRAGSPTTHRTSTLLASTTVTVPACPPPHPSCLLAPVCRLGVCEFLFPVQHMGGGGANKHPHGTARSPSCIRGRSLSS